MMARLFSKENAGRSVAVATAAHRVSFDGDGFAKVPAILSDLDRYRALGWYQDHSVDDERELEAHSPEVPRRGGKAPK